MRCQMDQGVRAAVQVVDNYGALVSDGAIGEDCASNVAYRPHKI